MAEVPAASLIPSTDIAEPPSPRAPKRPQSPSSPSTNPNKRARLSNSTDSPPTIRASPAASPRNEPEQVKPRSPLRRNSSSRGTTQEEKKRSLRLFGGMLNTISQSGPNLAEKKRQEKRLEIEKRQAEKARLQRLKDEEGRAERGERLKRERMKEQIKWDEDSMRVRHEHMLATAHFLRTKSKPVLYYKPWELRPFEAERIKEQIAEAEKSIEREVREFKAKRKPEEETVGQEATSAPTVATTVTAVTDSTNPLSQSPVSEKVARPSVAVERDTVDENSEVVVEGEEDTVIY